MRDEGGSQDAHEAGKDQQIGLVAVDQFDESAVESVPVRKAGMVQHTRIDSRPTRPVQAKHSGAIGNDRDYLAELWISSLDQSLQIAARSGNKYNNAAAHAISDRCAA